MPLRRQFRAEIFGDHHDPLMRPIGLVGRKQIDIAAQARQNPATHAAHKTPHPPPPARPPPCAMRRDRRHIIDLGHHVRAMRQTHQPHPAIRQQRAQIRRVQTARSADQSATRAPRCPRPPSAARRPNSPHGPDLSPQSRPSPRAATAAPPAPAHRYWRWSKARTTPARPFTPISAARRVARLVHLGPARLRARIGAIGLHLAIHVKPVQPVHHLTAGIRSPRIFKKRMARQHRAVKSRKLAAHKIQIKFGHQTPLLRFKTTAQAGSTDKQRPWQVFQPSRSPAKVLWQTLRKAGSKQT